MIQGEQYLNGEEIMVFSIDDMPILIQEVTLFSWTTSYYMN